MVQVLGNPKVQYFKTGTVDYLVGGVLYAYDAGTMNARYMYSSVSNALAGTNGYTSVTMDARGEADVVVSGPTKLILKDAPNGNTVWTVDNVDEAASDIFDSNGNELLKFVSTASAVNEVTITNAATSGTPRIDASGGDTNVNLEVSSKGSGTLKLDGGATGTVDIGTTSTGNINLKRATVVTGSVTATGMAMCPTGTILPFGGTSAPSGWLSCDGTAISRTTYSGLFAVLGTTWGVGNGTTTFNLPNLPRHTLVGVGGSGTATLSNTVGSTGGEETHTMTTGELVAHTHTYAQASSGAQFSTGGVNALTNSAGNPGQATSSTGSTTPFNVMQPSAVVMFIVNAV